MKNKLKKISKIFFIIWAILVFVCIALLIYVVGVRGELLNETNNVLAFLTIGSLGFGVLSFLAGTYFLTFSRVIDEESNKSQKKGFISLILQPFFPIFYFFNSIKNKSKKIRISGILLSVFVFFPIWIAGYGLLFVVGEELLQLDTEFSALLSSESMAPTLPGGTGYVYHPYKNIWYKLDSPKTYQFERGDIISFSTQRSREIIELSGREDHNLVKRIIGLPDEEIEIKGGVVFINGETLYEPYTLEENNTFAVDYFDDKGNITVNGFLKNCQKIVVPKKSLFVLGDNREYSTDSRIFGFVPFEDVIGYLTFDEQKIEYFHGVNRFKHNENWRDENGSVNVDELQIICD